MARKALKAESAKRLAEVRKRVDEANRKATEDKKLCNRTAFAIDYLYRQKDMAYLIKAMNDLGQDLPSAISTVAFFMSRFAIFSYIEGLNSKYYYFLLSSV